MANSHVAHNCRLGNRIILTNNAVLGGYVEVGDRAVLSASCAVHQFVRIGQVAIMRGMSATSRDVPPFSIIDWQHTVRGLNAVGLRRAGFDQTRIRALKNAFQILFRKRRNLGAAVKELEANLDDPSGTSPSCWSSSAHRAAASAPARGPIRWEDPERRRPFDSASLRSGRTVVIPLSVRH